MNRCRYVSPGASDRPLAPWIALSLLVALVTACGFPRPPDIGDDATPAGCARDQDCSSSTPFCVNAACAACRDSTTCPVARPVCDMVSHDCRTCAKDSECDSGACDLAAGRCVDQGAILYASPGGTIADPCTRKQPCALPQAATAVDPTHAYIVLLPGMYTQGFEFNSKNATVCGGGATLDADQVAVKLDSGSSIHLRNFKMLPGAAKISVFGTRSIVINSNNSDLTIDDADIEVTLPVAVQGGQNITIRNSTISHGLVVSFGALTVDRSTFLSGAGIEALSSDKLFTALNSVFVSSSGKTVLQINSVGDTSSSSGAYVANNTFSNGAIFLQRSCLQGL